MTHEVLLTIDGSQRFQDEAPETTSLVTDGTLRVEDGAVILSYAESELTGMRGTQTTFRIEKDRVTLTRTGAVQSVMVFSVGQEDRSLYDIGVGALMICVRTERISSTMDENGGVLEVFYAISIEDDTAGAIHYRITARRKT